MPPRKRAETKPEEPEQTTVPDPAATDDDPEPKTPDEPPTDEPKAPEKSDLQSVEQPCAECFPNGWANGAFSHGCNHGTWVRDHT